MDISQASEAANSFTSWLAQSIAPIDPVLAAGIAFAVGVLVGLIVGRKRGIKDFFKMPSAHWRIRRH